MGRRGWMGIVIAGAALGLGAGAAARADEPVSTTGGPVIKITSADDLLGELETADKSLRTFQCAVVYDKRFALQDDKQIRMGKLYYASEPGAPGARAKRTFAVKFDTLILDGASRPEELSLIFDGELLVEKRDNPKQWILRRIAPPGSPIDPLRLGEGPLPIPIGQPRAEIVARFETALLGDADDVDWAGKGATNYRDSVRGCWQLKLIPHDGTPDAERFREIRLWYAQGTDGRLLPRMAFTIDHKGDESFVQLIGARLNADLPAGVIDMTKPDAADGWDIQDESDRFDEAASDQ